MSRLALIRNLLLGTLGLVFLAYLVTKTYRGGNDINVYLFAAGSFLKGDNIYTSNPYNLYLYSPLFAAALSPFTLLGMSFARVLWMLLNVGLAIRIWFLLKKWAASLTPKQKAWWSTGVIILSLGFLNHNFMLGQVTILILWLTLEGMYQASIGKHVRAAILIALGINIKILPALVFAWFWMKGHFRAIVLTFLFLGLSFLLPSLVTGFQQNADLHQAWFKAINPSGERFAFEDNDGCHSLNAFIPAYFFDFATIERTIEPYRRNVHYPRMITHVPYDTLSRILLVLRIGLLLLMLYVFSKKSWIRGSFSAIPQRIGQQFQRIFTNQKAEPFDVNQFAREASLLCLITLLIFPHQMKYSMLYIIPAGAYLLNWYLSRPWNSLSLSYKALGILVLLFSIVLAVMGRDIVGNHLVDILDYYHFMSFANLLLLVAIVVCSDAAPSGVVSSK